MHGPVRPRVLAELSSAVEWVDDPGASGTQPLRKIDAFFGQHCVVGEAGGELGHDEIVCGAVAGVLEHRRRGTLGHHADAEGDQHFARRSGDACGFGMVALGHERVEGVGCGHDEGPYRSSAAGIEC